jgi:adenylylsulfate kinase
MVSPGCLIEIYTQCPLEFCIQGDPKGLYQKARLGQIQDFTGLNSPYEPPLQPDLILHTAEQSLESCTQLVLDHLLEKSILRTGSEA